jgi:hypothetical protein
MPRQLLGRPPRHVAHPYRRERAVLQHAEVREQVELLEHHADLAPHLVDRLEVLGQLDAVDDHPALLPILDPVDAAQQRRLAAARRTADHDALTAHDLQAHVAQHMEAAEPFIQTHDVDRDLARGRAHLRRRAPCAIGDRLRIVGHCDHRLAPVSSRRSV